MRQLIYISHANVVVDPCKPVPEWSLSDVGRKRHEAFGASQIACGVTKVYSSGETKALEAAETMFPSLRSAIVVRGDMHENDRAATGFLPPDEFESLADRFFGEPERSVLGWERAVDAQARITTAIDAVLAETAGHASVAVVGHGGVGTLLYCHLAGIPIDRRHDQPANKGGNVIVLREDGRRHVSRWTPMEDFD